MKKILMAMLLSMGTGHALADDISPMQGVSLKLLSMNGVAHYIVQDDEFLVTATFVEEGASTPIRFSASLRDGQSIIMAVPQAVGLPAQEIELVREVDRLVMRTPQEKFAAAELN